MNTEDFLETDQKTHLCRIRLALSSLFLVPHPFPSAIRHGYNYFKADNTAKAQRTTLLDSSPQETSTSWAGMNSSHSWNSLSYSRYENSSDFTMGKASGSAEASFRLWKRKTVHASHDTQGTQTASVQGRVACLLLEFFSVDCWWVNIYRVCSANGRKFTEGWRGAHPSRNNQYPDLWEGFRSLRTMQGSYCCLWKALQLCLELPPCHPTSAPWKVDSSPLSAEAAATQLWEGELAQQ